MSWAACSRHAGRSDLKISPHQALARLTPRQRAVLVLRFFEALCPVLALARNLLKPDSATGDDHLCSALVLDRLVVRLSPAAPHPEAQALVGAAASGDWPACRRILGTVEPAERTRLIRIAADHRRLGKLTGLGPDDATSAAFRASQLTYQGWKVRTDARARYVSREQFDVFHRYLVEAERVLHQALTGTPHDPALWTASLTVARGLQLGQEQARYRYDCLAAFDPHHLPGQSEFLQQLCPKWNGTWEAAEEFARPAMRAAPPGSENAVLIVEYHLERSLGQGRAGHLRTRQARADLEEAADRSVRHPGFRRAVGWTRTANVFAMAFSLAGDHAAAKQMFAMLGPYATRFPWQYQSSDIPNAFRRARARAYGLSGGLRGGVDALVIAATPVTGYVRAFLGRPA